jgi:ferric-dicitrate binding protein FerR (iron transport regulator)
VIDYKTISPTALALAFLFTVLVLLCVVPQVQAQTVAGSITAISGTATITRGAATIPAAYNTQVDVGDRIVTAVGSNLTITLSDGSQIEVTDSSTLTLDEDTLNANGTRSSTKMTLLSGLVRSLVRTTPGTPPNYEVHTPNAVASARGTFYDVDHETGVHDDKYKDCTEFTHVAVFQGNVDVFNPTAPGSPTVNVKEGQKVTVPCGGAPFFGAAPAGLGLMDYAAIGVLGAAGLGALAVIGYGADGGFGSSSGPTSPLY